MKNKNKAEDNFSYIRFICIVSIFLVVLFQFVINNDSNENPRKFDRKINKDLNESSKTNFSLSATLFGNPIFQMPLIYIQSSSSVDVPEDILNGLPDSFFVWDESGRYRVPEEIIRNAFEYEYLTKRIGGELSHSERNRLRSYIPRSLFPFSSELFKRRFELLTKRYNIGLDQSAFSYNSKIRSPMILSTYFGITSLQESMSCPIRFKGYLSNGVFHYSIDKEDSFNNWKIEKNTGRDDLGKPPLPLSECVIEFLRIAKNEYLYLNDLKSKKERDLKRFKVEW